eukprot:CAMPEP_0183727830 /NCGR_PEP_ID=MMETSP0737-20130205/26524_1 /TAXON_ID=385413 /ORGANISM="Thalassiosira miniscula, Strain CCMP1093" /LENGTH=377 /DNA_ID=CAMNT_0025959571 /DNA_START=98 /DNA_END=1228 /DNA_ORIENTATION=+
MSKETIIKKQSKELGEQLSLMVDRRAVVIDVGSRLTKAGFASEDTPQAVFRTITPLQQHHDEDENRSGGASLVVRTPIERGYILSTQWESMERIWHHTFYNELRVDPQSQPVLLTQPPLNPKATKERMVKLMFEAFNVPSIYISVDAVLAVYASGKTTGCVLDSGDGVTHIVPIYEGYHLQHAITRIDIAGSDVTKILAKLLAPRTTYGIDEDVAIKIKETLCYVAQDFSAEIEKPEGELEVPFDIPNGNTTIMIGKERFQCIEMLFQPNDNLVSSELTKDCNLEGQDGIVQATYKSMEIEAELFEPFCANIILTGGNTLFPGFVERFSKDMKKLLPPPSNMGVNARETRIFDAWEGGSITASLSTYGSGMWLTRDQ